MGIVELCAAVVLSPADALQKITRQYHARLHVSPTLGTTNFVTFLTPSILFPCIGDTRFVFTKLYTTVILVRLPVAVGLAFLSLGFSAVAY